MLRLRQDFDGKGTLGALLVSRLSDGAESDQLPHQSIGVDGTYRFLADRLQLSGFAAVTVNEERLRSHRDSSSCDRESPGGGVRGVRDIVVGRTAKFRARYVGTAFESDTTLRQVDCRFDPKVGFAMRDDVRVAQNRTGYTWRGWGLITRASISQAGTAITEDSSGRYLGFSTDTSVGASIANRVGVNLSVGYAEDIVDESFELPNDKEVLPGTYGGLTASLRAYSTERRNPYGGLNYRVNQGFYGGTSHTFSGRVGGAIGSHLRLSTRLSIRGWSLRAMTSIKPLP